MQVLDLDAPFDFVIGIEVREHEWTSILEDFFSHLLISSAEYVHSWAATRTLVAKIKSKKIKNFSDWESFLETTNIYDHSQLFRIFFFHSSVLPGYKSEVKSKKAT